MSDDDDLERASQGTFAIGKSMDALSHHDRRSSSVQAILPTAAVSEVMVENVQRDYKMEREEAQSLNMDLKRMTRSNQAIKIESEFTPTV